MNERRPTRFTNEAAQATAFQSTAELAEQLRTRLRLLAFVPPALLPLFLLARLPLDETSGISRAVVGAVVIFAALSGLTAAFVLTPRRLGVAALRVVEGVFVGSASTIWIAMTLHFLRHPPTDRPAALAGAVAASTFWVSTMIAYGVYIPNTWRRCAAVMVAMALGAILPDAFVASSWPNPVIQWSYVFTKLFWLVDGAVLGIYGAYRIEILTEGANVAQKLGQYVLKEKLGAGGMGEVYLAQHELLRRPCAVKLIRTGEGEDASAQARFEREVQATATLTHPNTVQIYDYGHAADGTFYYAMEYLPGASLEQLIERDGPMQAHRVVHLLAQLCGALAEAHALGLLHRDIKPSNVIICERGRVADVAKLLDFGLVSVLHTNLGDDRLTQVGLVLGTPAFMSPEQCAGDEELSPASDLYSLGALGYYLLAGRAPFAGRSPTQVLAAHLYEQPKSFSALGVAVSAAVEDAIFRCLAKTPSERFASAVELEQALRSAMG